MFDGSMEHDALRVKMGDGVSHPMLEHVDEFVRCLCIKLSHYSVEEGLVTENGLVRPFDEKFWRSSKVISGWEREKIALKNWSLDWVLLLPVAVSLVFLMSSLFASISLLISSKSSLIFSI